MAASEIWRRGKIPPPGDMPNPQFHHGHHGHRSHQSSGQAADTLSQLLASFQNNSANSDALNPTSIIMNTLSNAGITAPGS